MIWVITVIVFSIIIISTVFIYRCERRIVKKGHCGLPWMSFAMDSQGGIGLRCQKCATYGPWVSWYKKGICSRSWV